MSLYRTVLAEGQKSDLITFLGQRLLVEQWPVLSKVISCHIRDVWKEAFPELTQTFTTVDPTLNLRLSRFATLAVFTSREGSCLRVWEAPGSTAW